MFVWEVKLYTYPTISDHRYLKENLHSSNSRAICFLNRSTSLVSKRGHASLLRPRAITLQKSNVLLMWFICLCHSNFGSFDLFLTWSWPSVFMCGCCTTPSKAAPLWVNSEWVPPTSGFLWRREFLAPQLVAICRFFVWLNPLIFSISLQSIDTFCNLSFCLFDASLSNFTVEVNYTYSA
jgi:hypothetical protein